MGVLVSKCVDMDPLFDIVNPSSQYQVWVPGFNFRILSVGFMGVVENRGFFLTQNPKPKTQIFIALIPNQRLGSPGAEVREFGRAVGGW